MTKSAPFTSNSSSQKYHEVFHTETRRVSRSEALNYLEQYADHPSGYLTLNEGNQFFAVENIEAFIAYRIQGGYIFQLGGIVGPKGVHSLMLEHFVAFAARRRKRICAVQLRLSDLAAYEAAGFSINQLGLSYSLNIQDFQTAGTRFMKMRNKIKRAKKAGVTVHELGRDIYEDDATRSEIENITKTWLRAKGKSKLLEFMIGDLSPSLPCRRRIFAAYNAGKMLGFISYVPSYGEFEGMMHDLTRRLDRVPPGVMELINITAIERFRAENISYLNFGLTPFLGVEPGHDNAPNRSPTVSWLMGMLERHGQSVYPARAQATYKMKWQPITTTPEYVAFHGGFRWSGLFRLLQLTRTI